MDHRRVEKRGEAKRVCNRSDQTPLLLQARRIWLVGAIQHD